MIDEIKDFVDFAEHLTKELKNSIIVDQVVHSFEQRESLLKLLKEHISNHIVKVGRHTYRQIVGIPQGSIVSTLLCSFFYGDLERRELAHVLTKESCLIRYVDDFLFITADLDVAHEFCFMMHRGIYHFIKGFPDHGCEVNCQKTLVNFELEIDGQQLIQIDKYAPHEGFFILT